MDHPTRDHREPPRQPATAAAEALSAGERLRAHWRAELERWAVVSAHLPLGGDGRGAAVLALSRRAVRFLLRWYINPIVEQQNRFNAAAVSLDALDRARARELEREVAALRERVALLEARLRALEAPGGATTPPDAREEGRRQG